MALLDSVYSSDSVFFFKRANPLRLGKQLGISPKKGRVMFFKSCRPRTVVVKNSLRTIIAKGIAAPIIKPTNKIKLPLGAIGAILVLGL